MKHGQRGATMVEFAISALVTLMVLFGLMWCALLLYTYHTVASAARQGSRWAIVRGTGCLASTCPASASDVKTYVLSQMPLVDTTKVTVNTTWSSQGGCSAASSSSPSGPGCVVAVNVSYPFQLQIPFMSFASLTLSSTSKMVISE